MISQVDTALKATDEASAVSFKTLENQVAKLLENMKTDTTTSISNETQSALAKEEKNIQAALESLLMKNAESVKVLLDNVTPGILMSQQYGELTKYSKAASGTNEIVFALFFDVEGKPLPGHVNLQDPKINTYLKKGGEGDIVERVVAQAKNDPSVIILEFPISFYGTVKGKTIICMNRDSVISELDDLSKRFSLLNQSNRTSITTSLSSGSQGLRDEIQKALGHISRRSGESITETGRILKTAAQETNQSIRRVIIMVGVLCSVVILCIIGFILQLMVITPIRQVAAGLKDTAQGEGDLTKRLNLSRKDEIGSLARWFDVFLEKLDRIILDIKGNAATVTRGAEEACANAAGISDEVNDLADRADTVAAATEQMSSTMDSVAAASEEASTNVNEVSTLADRMKVTLNEVSANCDRARQVSDNARSGVKRATDKVARLGDAAKDITKVTQVITDIAEQTNLLALNATIEAARAGESGKGFAVVAAEIKDLASQTAAATHDIQSKIIGIQDSTTGTVEEVDKISHVILEVSEIVSSIAATVEEQSAAAANVADNIGQASTGIHEVNINVSQSSAVSGEIARDISGVNRVTGIIADKSSRMKEQAETLSELSEKLREMISVFKVSDSA